MTLQWLKCQGSFDPSWDHLKLFCIELPDSTVIFFCLFLFVVSTFPEASFPTQYCVFSCNSLPRRRSQLCWSLLTELATSGHTATAYLGGTLPTPFSEPAWCYHMLAQPDYSWTWVDGFAWGTRGDHVRLSPWLPWSSSAEAQAPAVVMQASAQSIDIIYRLSPAQTGFTARLWVHALCVKAWNWGRQKASAQ